MKLADKKCAPCEGGTTPFTKPQAQKLLKAIPRGWKLIGGRKLRKEYKFPDFAGTMAFVNKVALIAQEEGHHPDMEVHYAKCAVEFFTHSIGGLSENDFIMAAKIEQ
jgi:4a-hydroxytetrahydrobiopterin dehydratase